MFTKIQKRMKGDKGFTLIELLVVIIIIAILAAIAIPTFLGQRQKAQDAAAKSLVRNAMTAIESAYVDLRTFAARHDDPCCPQGDRALHHVRQPGDRRHGSDRSGLGQHCQLRRHRDTYGVGTASESGKTFGVAVNKGAGGGNTFYINGVAKTW